MFRTHVQPEERSAPASRAYTAFRIIITFEDGEHPEVFAAEILGHLSMSFPVFVETPGDLVLRTCDGDSLVTHCHYFRIFAPAAEREEAFSYLKGYLAERCPTQVVLIEAITSDVVML